MAGVGEDVGGVAGEALRLVDRDGVGMVEEPCYITRSLARAAPDIKAAAYADLGLTVTYHADGQALLESRPRFGV